MPSSDASSMKSAMGSRYGFGMYATQKSLPRLDMSLRHSSVLPVPTSPVILLKPSPMRAATSNVLSASCDPADEKKKLVSGVMLNGNSRRSKCRRYMALLDGPRGRRRVEPFDPNLRRVDVARPGLVALDHRGLEQDDELALGG